MNSLKTAIPLISGIVILLGFSFVGVANAGYYGTGGFTMTFEAYDGTIVDSQYVGAPAVMFDVARSAIGSYSGQSGGGSGYTGSSGGGSGTSCPPDYPYYYPDGLCYQCPTNYPYLHSDGQCYVLQECNSSYPYRWSDGRCYNKPEWIYQPGKNITCDGPSN